MHCWAWFLSGMAAGWVVAWAVTAVIVIGEISLLAMLGLSGSERRQKHA